VGWATLALMGTFYAVSGKVGRLGWINFWLSTAGVALMIPSLALYLGGAKGLETLVIAGSALAILGMLSFVAVVLSHWGSSKAAAA
jgi:hypothetical protein